MCRVLFLQYLTSGLLPEICKCASASRFQRFRCGVQQQNETYFPHIVPDIVYDFSTTETFLTTAMVCIPCIVIPVLLWVYKRFLEPIIYPFIAPFINTFWNKKPVTEASDTSDQKLGENGICKSENNGDVTANGATLTADKKTD